MATKKELLEFWRDVIIVVFAVLGFWLAILHAKHQGVDVSPIILALFCVIIAAVLIWICYRNLRDARRAESKHIQIESIKQEHNTQTEALKNYHKRETDQLTEIIKSKQRELDERDQRHSDDIEEIGKQYADALSVSAQELNKYNALAHKAEQALNERIADLETRLREKIERQ